MKKILLLTASLFAFICADEFVEDGTTSIGGYGELHYDIEANDGDGKLDFHRFIFYIKHQFDSQWSMMSEVEIEHNMVYSEGDGGYLAMEQAYLNYSNGNWGWKGGVLLVPAGITNEYHEPPTFMSVERPEYNKYIIPTTWFDNGFAFYGKNGDFNWNFTMTGDLDGDGIGKGIRSGRLKGVSTTTASWTKTLQGSWTGMKGVKLGGSITMNDAPVSDDHVNGGEAIGVTLAEFNGTYSKNNMYARLEYGMIDYTNNWHDLDGSEDGVADYEVESSSGYYLDLGYNIADMVGCDGDLYVWMRNSSYNKDDNDDATDISLFGLTLKPLDNISFKLEMGTKNDDDVMRMGLGYMF